MEFPDEREIFEAYLDKAASEAASLATQIQSCKRCNLHKIGKRPISGAGYPLADLFLLKGQVSESEYSEGVTFAGKIIEALRKAFEKLELEISFVYGTNAVKCYGKGKELEKSELKVCLSYLKEEIAICEPRVILAMGSIACYVLKMLGDSLEEIEYKPGGIFKLRPDLQVVVTCDLEKALSDENLKRRFWKDLQLAKALIDKEIAKEQEN